MQGTKDQIGGAVRRGEPRRTASAFFALTVLLTIPFWALTYAMRLELLPGLPPAALAVVCPLAAAVLLSWKAQGRRGVASLLRASAWSRGVGSKPTWLLVLTIPPAVAAASFLYLRVTGHDVPDPEVFGGHLLVLLGLFLLGAWTEEVGWTAFALPRLQTVQSPLTAGLSIGLFWAIWHYPALIDAGRSPAWIGWWTLGAVAFRLVLVWSFNGAGGSLLLPVALHAVSNLCWQLFPIQGSHFDPRSHGLIMAAVALALVPRLFRR